MKRFDITNKKNGLKFQVEALALNVLQPEWGDDPDVIETDLTPEINAEKAKQAQEDAKKARLRNLKDKGGKLDDAEVRELLKALVEKVFG
jgi:hypothetical protein